jgi:hypothetical protein
MSLINLPTIVDSRGNLTFFEKMASDIFEIKRIFYLYQIPLNSLRGGHAHYNCKQLIIPIAGSFNVTITTKNHEIKNYILETPEKGLYVPEMSWVVLDNFSNDAVCLVLADQYYEEADYIRDFNNFIKLISRQD